MDDRQGNVYPSREDAIAAGVPHLHAHEVDAIDPDVLIIVSGPMRGRFYRRTATGLRRLLGAELALAQEQRRRGNSA